MRQLIYLAVALLLIVTIAYAKEDEDQVTYSDFTLNIAIASTSGTTGRS